MVVGVDDQATFDRDHIHLQSGDIILLYTDGAVEALNFNDERYGRQRLAASLRRYAEQPAHLLVNNILWDLRRFRGLADRFDDLTLVAVKIR
jgi:sigma-B regulation protein RsbU (phosphoserine phosphatase)